MFEILGHYHICNKDMIPKLFFCIFSGFRCWDSELFDINDELAQIANKADLGEEGPNGKGFFPHFEVIDIFRVNT